MYTVYRVYMCCSLDPWVTSSDRGYNRPKKLLLMVSMVSQISKVGSNSKYYDRYKSIMCCHVISRPILSCYVTPHMLGSQIWYLCCHVMSLHVTHDNVYDSVPVLSRHVTHSNVSESVTVLSHPITYIGVFESVYVQSNQVT